jgi:hypothetical protein
MRGATDGWGLVKSTADEDAKRGSRPQIDEGGGDRFVTPTYGRGQTCVEWRGADQRVSVERCWRTTAVMRLLGLSGSGSLRGPRRDGMRAAVRVEIVIAAAFRL